MPVPKFIRIFEMKPMLTTLSSLLILLCSGFLSFAQDVETRVFAYYITSDINSGGSIAVVDPSALNDAVEYIEVPVEEEWRLPSIMRVSPDGEWIVFVTSLDGEDGRNPRFVRLFNLISGEIHDLNQGYVLGVEWSPDNRFLALSQGDVFIHSVLENNTINLTNDDEPRVDIAWSNDSTKIAALIDFCLAEGCTRQLEILGVENDIYQISPDLRDTALSLGPLAGLNCKLDWSPNGRYVSFMIGCPQSLTLEVARELFVWDTDQEILQQVTNFTTSAFQPGGTGIAGGDYNSVWFDANTLLIGASQNPSTDGASYNYNVTENTLNQLFSTQVDEWARNPVTNQMVGRQVQPETLNAQSTDSELPSGNVEIFTLDQSRSAEARVDALAVPATLPDGCNFYWSPDGTTLAYSVPRSGCPGTDTAQFVFVDAATGEYTEFTPTLPDGSAPLAVVPLGWVAR